MKICDFKAFTLAEVMIVLTVIGVLTAILLPVARQSMPDENLMKFKKAHNTLGTVIRELVTSDKYYRDGDLGKYPDGSLVNASTSIADVTLEAANAKYFCKTIVDLVNAKISNCYYANTSHPGAIDIRTGQVYAAATSFEGKQEITKEAFELSKHMLDLGCKRATDEGASVTSGGITYGAANVQIVLSDNIVFFEANPTSSFGYASASGVRRFPAPEQFPARYSDENGFSAIYKVFCIDVDGVPETATEDDCVNECPFGYGIRADGKILTGARADEWLARETLEE